MVLGVVFLTLGAVIREAYILCDEVTGAMILEESLERLRYNREEEKDETFFEGLGEKEGNPRLWLGNYQLELDMGGSRSSGSGAAGGWRLQMEMKNFEPETFLRKLEAFRALRRGQDGSGS